ncbi:Toprim domain-containing protein [Roseivivax lentus]|uniref:Toprim domain-containing protein n=1 Tax=Roseivivax lentus TaxID=633194 RepID=A0A1N7Q6C8_9RHOB|nr:toprim domain-containing protein [Roseivivax lentus]SIT18403.1 Toprim domain-containing protein [Roseivivax lentus]
MQINAKNLTQELGGIWYGTYGVASCPLCQPERRKGQNALTLADGDAKLLLHCKRMHCGFRDVLAAAGVNGGDYRPPDPEIAARRETERLANATKRAVQAERCWKEAQPIVGTIAETYLRKARGISCCLPTSLRFHPECWHGATASKHPALVALVEGGDGFAVHRTYLSADGGGKARLTPSKAMLGAVSGGAVTLSKAAPRLVVGEGIESTLSLLCGFLEGSATVWAALSTSGLRGLRLPTAPGRLTIAQDGDAAGREGAHALAQRAYVAGWRVGILDPGDGADFNDILSTGKAVRV